MRRLNEKVNESVNEVLALLDGKQVELYYTSKESSVSGYCGVDVFLKSVVLKGKDLMLEILINKLILALDSKAEDQFTFTFKNSSTSFTLKL